MLDRGAVTFWEEFDPNAPEETQYGMYGDKFGKSLCHAWAASPIYLIGKYFLRIRPLEPGYETFEVAPALAELPPFTAAIPVGDGTVSLAWNGTAFDIYASKSGGTLLLNGQRTALEPGQHYTFKIMGVHYGHQ